MDSSASLNMSSAKAIRTARKQRTQDFLFHAVTQFFSLLVLVALLGIIASLFINAAPALEEFGVGFFFDNEWDIVNGKFGGLIAIY